jgi:hypothetical protein
LEMRWVGDEVGGDEVDGDEVGVPRKKHENN